LADTSPSHDPDDNVDLTEFFDDNLNSQVVTRTQYSRALKDFFPYPNFSSFALSDWYWNDGVQKSQQSFQKLVQIVSNRDFELDEIRHTNWSSVNNLLGNSTSEQWNGVSEGWIKTSVTIPVPFHRFTQNPGVSDYVVADFHYRSLVSVISEKMKNPAHHKHFHHEPYELLWMDSHSEPLNTRIYGELYTSAAFRDAHRLLQETPGEPDCDLPRSIVALMFWSDATHLTAFGNAKLWPLYLFFGNDSKYCRSKPSNNLCEHVAYFEKVTI
jgi:hypothetical protein